MNWGSLISAIFSAFKRAPAPMDGTNGNGYQPVATPGPAPTPPAPVLPPVVNDPPPMPTVAPAAPPRDDAWRVLCRPLVQHFESCALGAYWDPTGKVWTCGWGSTGPDVKEGTVWTQAQADVRLDSGLDDAAAAVDRVVKVTLSPQQKAALVSIFYNVGPGRAASGRDPGRDGIAVLANGQPSTLMRNLNALNFASAADQFLAWNKSGGVVLNGLVKRRTAERSLFLTGAWK